MELPTVAQLLQSDDPKVQIERVLQMMQPTVSILMTFPPMSAPTVLVSTSDGSQVSFDRIHALMDQGKRLLIQQEMETAQRQAAAMAAQQAAQAVPAAPAPVKVARHNKRVRK